MKSPEEKSVGYAAAIVVCGIVISLVISAIKLFVAQEMMKLNSSFI